MDRLLSLKQRLNHSMAYKRFADWRHRQAIKNNPKREANRCYRMYFSNDINWENPRNIVEKTFWLLLHTDTSLWTQCTDKYLVRDYVTQCGLAYLLVKQYGSWNDANEIDFDSLPNKFVLKPNHTCSQYLIVKDKTKLNLDKVRETCNNWLKIPYGYSGMQLHYLGIKPRLIADELLEGDTLQRELHSNSLIDYKFVCCEGEPQCVFMVYGRDKKGINMALFDMNWNRDRSHINETDVYRYPDDNIPKPVCFDEMVEACKILSKPFPQVRCDFYVINGKPYFGELTFTSAWGFWSYDFYDELGDKIDLTKVKRIK